MRRERGFGAVGLLVGFLLIATAMGAISSSVHTAITRMRDVEEAVADAEALISICQMHYLRDSDGDMIPDGIWPTESDLRRYLPGWDGKNPWGNPISLRVDSASGLLFIEQKLPARIAEAMAQRIRSGISVRGSGNPRDVTLTVPPPAAAADFRPFLPRAGGRMEPGAVVTAPGGRFLDLFKAKGDRIVILSSPVDPNELINYGYYYDDVEQRLGQIQVRLPDINITPPNQGRNDDRRPPSDTGSYEGPSDDVTPSENVSPDRPPRPKTISVDQDVCGVYLDGGGYTFTLADHPRSLYGDMRTVFQMIQDKAREVIEEQKRAGKLPDGEYAVLSYTLYMYTYARADTSAGFILFKDGKKKFQDGRKSGYFGGTKYTPKYYFEVEGDTEEEFRRYTVSFYRRVIIGIKQIECVRTGPSSSSSAVGSGNLRLPS